MNFSTGAIEADTTLRDGALQFGYRPGIGISGVQNRPIRACLQEAIRQSNPERLRSAPFEVKKEVVKTMIDKVIVDTKGAWIEFEGQIRGRITPETRSGA